MNHIDPYNDDILNKKSTSKKISIFGNFCLIKDWIFWKSNQEKLSLQKDHKRRILSLSNIVLSKYTSLPWANRLLLETLKKINTQNINKRGNFKSSNISSKKRLKFLQLSWNLAGWIPSNKIGALYLATKLDNIIDSQDIIIINFQELIEMKLNAKSVKKLVMKAALTPIKRNLASQVSLN